MLKKTVLFCSLILSAICVYSQIVTECPQNIGFERGNFSSWECYIGNISGTGRNFLNAKRPATINVSASGAVAGIHTLIKKGSRDQYGGFSLDAPNGSDYVVRLGNDNNNRGAETISYTLRVPSNVEDYSIIFNYAVVLENPDHEYDEQPKFTAKVIDVSNNTTTECGSFEFTAPGSGSSIPGFQSAANSDSVLFKPWSPVMVNLSNYIGRTIRLEFTTNDCSRGRHFGYAYIDFNENCSIPITGNITCSTVDSLKLEVIPGLAQYNWFNAQTLEPLGNGSSLKLKPIPPVGTKIGVELIPYAGLGCIQTLYTTITNMYMNVTDPPERCNSVDITATSVTVGNSSDLTYTYWKNSNANAPLSDPKRVLTDGTYYIKGSSSSGCNLIRPVQVNITKLKPIIITQPDPVAYPTTVDLSSTFTQDKDLTYTYYTNPQATLILKNPTSIRFGGTYYVKGVNQDGCISISPITVSVSLPDFFAPNTFTPNGDGVNDLFTIIVGDKILVKNFKVFNRWGNIVYETVDITQYWDGLKQNVRVPEGVYFWILEGNEKLKFLKKSGYVTVIR